jgi:hypothetical protein
MEKNCPFIAEQIQKVCPIGNGNYLLPGKDDRTILTLMIIKKKPLKLQNLWSRIPE